MARAKQRTVFVCDACGNETLRWEGRCPACGQWNTLAEVRRDAPRAGRGSSPASAGPALELSQVSTDDFPRTEVTSGEFNRVMGGGLVPGSLTLVAGDPGIGKSTLLLRVAADVAEAGGKALYACGEESASQVKLRAERLGITGRSLYLLPATDLGEILSQLEEHSPDLAVVDSIQTVFDDSVPSAAGTVAQIRECTRRLMDWAKSRDVPMILSGHVTKSGEIAGPRVLEHMVDVVLYMEGDPISAWRLLRSVKNRFGSTNEVGVFEMTGRGLAEVDDPSQAFLSGRRDGAVGSVVVATMEGSRPLLGEVQALTTPSLLPAPRRVASGVDFNRLLLVCAVLTRRLGISLAGQDVIVNVTGGLRLSEPAADLGMALAVVSSVRNQAVDARVAAVGEVGLSGEVRMVPQLERRLGEAARLGLRRCIIPRAAGDDVPHGPDVEVVRVDDVGEAIRACVAKPSGVTAGRDGVDEVAQ